MRSFRYSPFSLSDDSSAVRYASGSGLKELPGEAGHETVDLGQLLRRRQEYDAEKSAFRGHAESRAVDAEHAGRAQQAEDVVDVGFSGRQLQLRHHVE